MTIDSKKAWRLSSVNRRLAVLSNSNKYFSFKECPFGHLSGRYTKSGKCVECARLQTKDAINDGYFKSIYESNSEKIKDRSKKRYAKNKDSIKESAKLWQENNKEKVKSYKTSNKLKRKDKIKNGDSSKVIYSWLESVSKTCAYCGRCCVNNYHIDHIMPLSRGGLHVVSNLAISCPTCNMQKSSKTPEEYAKYLARFKD